MTNKERQRKRMMSYFIDSTIEIIEKEGIEAITLKKIAKGAGYNTATIYNYFENLDHLIFYAAMNYMKDYAKGLNQYLINAKNSMDRFLMIWDCFCDYAFDKPEIYNIIFFPKLENNMEFYISEYYSIFPEDLIMVDKKVLDMLLKRDINKRNEITIIGCVEEGFISKEDGYKLNEMTLLIFEGILSRVFKSGMAYEDARNKTMDYIKTIVKSLLIKDYEFYY